MWALVGFGVFLVASRIDYRRWRKFAPYPCSARSVALVAGRARCPASASSSTGSRRWLVLGTDPGATERGRQARVAALRRRHPRPPLGSSRRPARVAAGARTGFRVRRARDEGTRPRVDDRARDHRVRVADRRGVRVPSTSTALVGGRHRAARSCCRSRAGYRRARMFAFLHPGHDVGNTGYQLWRSLIAVGSGGVSGVGLGNGRAKWFFLPNAHTDFIFAIIGEELGFIGCLLVLGLFAGLGARRTAHRTPRAGSVRHAPGDGCDGVGRRAGRDQSRRRDRGAAGLRRAAAVLVGRRLVARAHDGRGGHRRQHRTSLGHPRIPPERFLGAGETEDDIQGSASPVMSGEVFALLAGGGTGGHTYPAIAVAQELERRGRTVRFVGGTPRHRRNCRAGGRFRYRPPLRARTATAAHASERRSAVGGGDSSGPRDPDRPAAPATDRRRLRRLRVVSMCPRRRGCCACPSSCTNRTLLPGSQTGWEYGSGRSRPSRCPARRCPAPVHGQPGARELRSQRPRACGRRGTRRGVRRCARRTLDQSRRTRLLRPLADARRSRRAPRVRAAQSRRVRGNARAGTARGRRIAVRPRGLRGPHGQAVRASNGGRVPRRRGHYRRAHGGRTPGRARPAARRAERPPDAATRRRSNGPVRP